ncbi:hypothetical protein LJK88_19255 [Paenibacillus sp. P26]|nr:hypothetical protein LJK88_19255 [Paenibacillus sp. P26]UUZ97901.1 hypothetical protein LJK87_18570 [Paenibacillus sp. P25]
MQRTMEPGRGRPKALAGRPGRETAPPPAERIKRKLPDSALRRLPRICTAAFKTMRCRLWGRN